MSILKDKDFHLEPASDNENENTRMLIDADENKYHSKKPAFIRAGPGGAASAKKIILTTEDHLYNLTWYVRLIFWMLFVLLLLLIGTLVTIIVLLSTTSNSPEFTRAMRLVDRVYEMHDYTKTMTDVTTQSQEKIAQAIVDYRIPEMVDSLKSVISRGDQLIKALPSDVVQQATSVGSKLAQSLEHVDFENSNQLIRHLNEWAISIDPNKISTGVQQATSFLQKGTEMLQTAQEQQLVQHVGQFAAQGVELESRLKRLNEITIKLP